MTRWIATTESGTTYELREGHVTVNSRRTGVTSFPLHRMQSCRNPTVEPWSTEPDAARWRDVERPVQGENLFISGMRDWRISTAIASVTDLRD